MLKTPSRTLSKSTVPKNNPARSSGDRVQTCAHWSALDAPTNGCQNGTSPSLIGRPARPATTRFEAGPASAIAAIACFGFAVLAGFTGTGFAHPKPTKKMSEVPMGS